MGNETICVIGVSGFVGSHVTAELLRRGYNVRGTLRSPDNPASAWITERLANQHRAKLTLHAAR